MLATDAQRWGIIGLGGQAVGIARALDSVEDVELVACRSSTATRTEEFASMFGCQPYSSDEEFFAADLDLVVVAGVNAKHATDCVGALEAGSAVLCEKPMALSRDDATRIVEVGRRASRPVYTGYHYRFRALSREMRDAIRGGAVGDVRDVRMQRTSEHSTATVRDWRRNLSLAGAGVMCDVGVHLVDFVTWVTGLQVMSVGAVANPPREQGRPEEHVVVDLELDSGALATIDAARSLPNASNALEVHGTEGSLYTGPLRWVDSFSFEVRRADDVPQVTRAPANAPLLEEMIAVRDALRGTESDLLASAEDGREGATVLEAVIQSLETKSRAPLSRA